MNACMWSRMHVCTTYVRFVYLCVCTDVCVCVRPPQRPRGGVKPLRAVYTNTPTKDTSCCQSGREIYLPDSLEHLRLFKRKQATDFHQSGTQNCCHIAELNPRLVSLQFCECDGVAAYALWWTQRCGWVMFETTALGIIDDFLLIFHGSVRHMLPAANE